MLKVVLASPSNQYKFPQRSRIKQREDFEQVLASTCLNNRWFAVYVKDSANAVPRLGLIVSKRIMPKSVSRNYAKRLIREVFRKNIQNLRARDYVVKIKRHVMNDTSNEARTALEYLLTAANAQ